MDLPKDFLYMLYRAPSLRYHDTSYIINKKWQKGGEELTFPVMYSFANSDLKLHDYISGAIGTNFNDNENDINKSKFKNWPDKKIKSIDECVKQTSNNVEIYTTSAKEANKYDSANYIAGDVQTVKLIVDKTSNIEKNSNNDIMNENKYSSNNVTKLDENNINNNSSYDKSNNKTRIIVSYQAKLLPENLTENKNETKYSQISLSPQVPRIELNEISHTADKLIDEKLLVNSTFNNIREGKTYKHIKSISIADVHSKPIALPCSTILSDVLVIKENSSDEENEGTFNLAKEIQRVPKFSKNQISKSLNTIEEIDATNSIEKYASDQEETRRKKHPPIINEYESDNNFITKNSQPISFNGRKCYDLQSLRVDCISPSSVGTSISTINESDFDYSTSDYEIVDFSKRNYSFPFQSKRHRYSSTSSIADNLRLHYVTQRILASLLPRRDDNIEEEVHSTEPRVEGQLQDEYEKEIIIMLEQKHGKNYRVYDLESCISVITLERICELCKRIDKWLGSDPERVVVLQDRDNRQRLGVTIAAYLEYLNICASSLIVPRNNNCNRQSLTSAHEDLRAQNTISKNWLDLDIFSMKKFLEDFIGPLRIPSHRQYIQYFSRLLSGKVKMNSAPLNVKCISIDSPPSWLKYNEITFESEWSSFIKIYEGLHCIYTSDIHIIPITTRQILFQMDNLQLHGDILIRFYHILPTTFGYNNNNNDHFTYNCEFELNKYRELLFSLQFHTCAMDSKEAIFKKNDLDYAWCDNRFPKDCKITFYFDHDNGVNSYLFQSPLIRVEPANSLAKADSIENFDLSSKYQGPLNGSLYTTISKKRNFSPYASTSNSVNLIQTAPDIINHQTFELPVSQRNSISTSKRERTLEPPVRTSSLYVRSTQSLPRSTSNCCYINNLSNSSQSNCKTSQQAQAQLISNINQFSPEKLKNYLQEIYNQQNDYTTGQHVSNRFTLCVDSKISSNDLLNCSAIQQRSSVPPKTVPSELSSHEDRHHELDEIISDMLMTVRDIPDFIKNKNQKQSSETQNILRKQQTQRQIRSQSAVPIDRSTSSVHILLPNQNTNNNYQQYQQQIKRSRSYNSYINKPVILHQNINQSAPLTKEHLELYADTSSTATTLTPPPSENGGCDTPTTIASNIISPISTIDNISATNTLQHQQQQQYNYRERCETYNSMASSSSSKQSSLIQQQNQTYNLQQKLNLYQKKNNSISEDEENIPYHAREHSQPFSYGSVPNYHKLTEALINNNKDNNPDLDAEIIDSKMIKAQSGLSSPSLVRKFAGGINTNSMCRDDDIFSSISNSKVKKTTIRSDFEEKLNERRQKVLSEKYSTISNTSQTDHYLSNTTDCSNKWLPYQVNQTNCYHYYSEPLKRSNTLDDFQRSNSTEKLSGQNWLQFQQQKLREKKNQQLLDERKYFENINTEIKNRSQKYRMIHNDGYASDSAAFSDEIDYRQPLHIQTSNNAQSSPERKYNTIATTTTTVSKERPFVPFKRVDPTTREADLVREESISSYRFETDTELSNASSPRPETPAFPTTPRTPHGLNNGSVNSTLPPKSPISQRKDYFSQRGKSQEIINQNEMYSTYGTRRHSNSSNANSETQEVAAHHVKLVRDSSKYWYKPTLSREEAISLLRHAPPGTFLVRDSTSYKNAFGLVLRVAYPPPGVTLKPGGDELVRHFLIEPTNRGVRLKGCTNEPTFTSLSALIYQHSITNLALPCRLNLPENDITSDDFQSSAQKQLLTQGAACNILYLYACETESLTGEEAVRRAISELYSLKPLPLPTIVHFKVSQQGITLTDNARQKFFRKHYSANVLSYCGFDPDRRTWSIKTEADFPVQHKTIFAFVARRSASSADNQCHVFCDLVSNQPASAIVSFINKILPIEKSVNNNI